MNKMKDNIDCLIEWAVWGNLQSKNDLEGILLRGHILIDIILSTSLKRMEIQKCDTFSFHSKVKAFEKVNFSEIEKHKFLCKSLYELNNLRNKLAHEVDFNFRNGNFESWSLEIIKELDGMKYSNFTRRTKIVHSFSFLAKAILELR